MGAACVIRCPFSGGGDYLLASSHGVMIELERVFGQLILRLLLVNGRACRSDRDPAARCESTSLDSADEAAGEWHYSGFDDVALKRAGKFVEE